MRAKGLKERALARIKRNRRTVVVLACLTGVLIVCLLLAAAVGAVSIPPLDIAKMTLNKIGLTSFSSIVSSTSFRVMLSPLRQVYHFRAGSFILQQLERSTTFTPIVD